MAALHLRVLVRSGLGQRGGGGHGGSLSLRQRQHHHDCQDDLQKPPTLHCCDFAVMTSCLFFFFSLPRTTIRASFFPWNFSEKKQQKKTASFLDLLLGLRERLPFQRPLVVITAVLTASPRRSVCSLTSSVSGGRRLGEWWTEVTRNWLVAIHSGRGDSCLQRLGVGVEPRGRGVEGIVLYWHAVIAPGSWFSAICLVSVTPPYPPPPSTQAPDVSFGGCYGGSCGGGGGGG